MFRYAFATLVFRLLALTLVLSSGCFDLYSGSEQLRQAEELTRQERYDEAIVIYRAHMEERLAIEERQEWENPYFYLLLIGDVQLGRGEPAAALEIYQEAEQHKVEAGLTTFRFLLKKLGMSIVAFSISSPIPSESGIQLYISKRKTNSKFTVLGSNFTIFFATVDLPEFGTPFKKIII